jgi:hypothetical protein
MKQLEKNRKVLTNEELLSDRVTYYWSSVMIQSLLRTAGMEANGIGTTVKREREPIYILMETQRAKN